MLSPPIAILSRDLWRTTFGGAFSTGFALCRAYSERPPSRNRWHYATRSRCHGSPHAGMVTERRREIGIRVALGATRSHVLVQIMNQALQVTALGLAIGLAG